MAEAFPPIADYGFLADCETAALLASSGNVEWLCLPRLDSPSVFGAMLDRGAGGFRVGPEGLQVPASRRYIPGTLVLETTWRTGAGWLVVLDALLMTPDEDDGDEPGAHAAHVLLRIARCVAGEVDLRVDCRPVFDYGRHPAGWAGGENGAALIASADGADLELALSSDLDLEIDGEGVTAGARLAEGDIHFVALAWGADAPGSSSEGQQAITATCRHWQRWLDAGTFPDHPWSGFLQRSALTLKGLTYAPTGAMVAAATTSLPETPGGERNWDYRYTWVRDSALVLWALSTLGFAEEADAFYGFLGDLAEEAEGDLSIMYGIDGERELPERELEHLAGYEGATPVRVGNGAHTQAQHDIWGELMAATHLHLRDVERIGDRGWAIITSVVERALECWREPDHGPWESRGAMRHHTMSKIACWMAADRGARLARRRQDSDNQERWRAAAEEIRADILSNGVDERGVLTQHYETSALDASLLTVPLSGFLAPDDERVRATVSAIADELTEEGLVLRYRVSQTDDGLTGREGTFAFCSFLLVSALVEIGEVGRAKSLCEKLLSYASPLGLYGEQIDPHTGRHLGNFPQALTHLALINAVTEVILADQGRSVGRL